MAEKKRGKKLSIEDIALMGMMVAVIEACKLAMAFLPNIELTSFWIIMFTLLFQWRILFVIPVFILVEGAVYGFGLWWVMYLYAWPMWRSGWRTAGCGAACTRASPGGWRAFLSTSPTAWGTSC